MSWSIQTLKVFTIIWDIIFAVFGVCLVGVGSYIFVKLEYFEVAAFLTFGLGIGVLLIVSFGIISALRERNRMLKVFTCVLLIVALIHILLVVFFWIFQTTLLINVDQTFDELWRGQPVPIKPGNASQVANLEKWLDCCGNVGPDDYILPPYSCYNNNDKLNLEGCRQKFLDYIADRWIAFNIFAIGLVTVEIMCAVFSSVLASGILNRWRRSKYYPK